MDKETIKKELDDLIYKGLLIFLSSNVEYDTNVLKKPNKTLQELSKNPLEVVPMESLEKGLEVLGESLESVSKKQLQSFAKLVVQDTIEDRAKKIKYPKSAYYAWYDRACEVVRVLRPNKLKEFEELYTGNKAIKKAEDWDSMNAGTKHYVGGWAIIKNGETIDFFTTFTAGFNAQRNILSAISENFDNELFNLEKDIGYGIYKSTMDIAKDIQQEDPRIAGAIACVVLEVHLKKLAVKNGIEDKEKNSITDYNNFLKRKGVYDKILADQIKSCNKTRNKCVHTNKGEPMVGEVSTVIHIVDRVVAEVN